MPLAVTEREASLRSFLQKQGALEADVLAKRNADLLKNVVPAAMHHAATTIRTTPRTSIVIPAFNEGDSVLKTVEALMKAGADEVIVVDDGSTDGSCDPRKFPSETHVIRHNAPCGVGQSRIDGISASTGDVVGCADGHVSGPEGSLSQMAMFAMERQAVVCPATCARKHPNLWTIYGADLILETERGCFEHWCRGGMNAEVKPPEMRFSPITCLYGSVYLMPRTVWRRMRGFEKTYRFGYHEQLHSLRAYFSGVPMFCDTRSVWHHGFKKERKHRWREHMVWNYYLGAYLYFSDEVFWEFFEPKITKTFRDRFKIVSSVQDIVNSILVRGEKERFEPAKVHTDQEFFIDFLLPNHRQIEGKTRFSADLERDGE